MKWFRKKFNAKPILDRYMDGDFELFACGKDAPAEKDVRAFEQIIGFGLPPEFVEFSTSPLGGVYIAVKEAIWSRPKAYAVGPFWSFLYGLHTMGFGKGIPEWMDIRIQTKKFKTDTGHNVVPFLKVIGDADVYCFDSRGETARWDHETDELKAQGKTFAEVLAYEVGELKDRKERKKAEQAAGGNATEPRA